MRHVQHEAFGTRDTRLCSCIHIHIYGRRQVHEALDAKFQAWTQGAGYAKVKSCLVANARVPIINLTCGSAVGGGREAGEGRGESGGARGDGSSGKQTRVGEEEGGGVLDGDVSANKSSALHHCLLMRYPSIYAASCTWIQGLQILCMYASYTWI